MVTFEPVQYSYLVDAQDRIAWVSPNWLAFARENGAVQLDAESVLGQSLWSFIHDDGTRLLYKGLMRQIRARGTRVSFPFRCDSPRLRRYMRLTIESRANNCLRFDSTLVRTVPRNYVAVLDATAKRSAKVLTMCSICQKTLIEPIGWMEVEDAMAHLQLLVDDAPPHLRHTVCAACEDANTMTVPLCQQGDGTSPM